ncbi:hypothetical protein NCLIV_019380 [Neospora caninum Liverpool]|nr:hypothetical protein NCLIV_019380 [Neospora caninum Liverpool]CBZ52149.1 hypothetical protein NCLIV_019380 [Neospora caninum Liverpool]|eukprot:XP_003882181.1 hypothetical protein NCLIV_019380 [Neospora caninum Liverpool]
MCTSLAAAVSTGETTAWESTVDTEDEARTENAVTLGDSDATDEEDENYNGPHADVEDDARTENMVTEEDGDAAGEDDKNYNGLNRSSTLKRKRGQSSRSGVAMRVSTIQRSGRVRQEMRLGV